MSTLPLALIQNPAWLGALDRGTERISALARSVPTELNKRMAKFSFYFAIRRVNAELQKGLDDLDKVTAAAQHEYRDVLVPAELTQISEVVTAGMDAYRKIERIYAIGSLAGLRKKPLTAAPMRHLHELLERIGDYVFWLQEMTEEIERPEADASYRAGLEELARGETIALL